MEAASVAYVRLYSSSRHVRVVACIVHRASPAFTCSFPASAWVSPALTSSFPASAWIRLHLVEGEGGEGRRGDNSFSLDACERVGFHRCESRFELAVVALHR